MAVNSPAVMAHHRTGLATQIQHAYAGSKILRLRKKRNLLSASFIENWYRALNVKFTA
ncbi:hypothetical protein [Dolichospermum lemmermannii]|uniref:hypothetical protein n=1 Tax=Dolichospermum lemmermannii TaxID=54295 RepID=UPI00232E6AC6|nr:hypothetical protein [Dolichospermum lemmermannii]